MHAHWLRSLFITGTSLTLALIGVPSGAQADTGCPNADLQLTGAADVPVAERATRCLVNYERRRHGLHPMRFSVDLKRASRWQARDMIRHSYFAHQRSGGPAFTRRIKRFGYAAKARSYSIGENLAWSTADIASPRETVASWMSSPGHRANILRRQFRDQAVAAAYSEGNLGGDYSAAGPLVIYVNQFGGRY